MRISDWSSDVCSSDLAPADHQSDAAGRRGHPRRLGRLDQAVDDSGDGGLGVLDCRFGAVPGAGHGDLVEADDQRRRGCRHDRRLRSEEHTSELQSLMRISYAVFCLKKKNTTTTTSQNTNVIIN